MFENLSKRSLVLIGGALVLTVGAVVSAIVDHKNPAEVECECECGGELCDCAVADPTAEL